MSDSPFKTFRDFYPYYLSEHADPTCRRLHFVGSCVVLVCLGLAVAQRNGWWLWAISMIERRLNPSTTRSSFQVPGSSGPR